MQLGFELVDTQKRGVPAFHPLPCKSIGCQHVPYGNGAPSEPQCTKCRGQPVNLDLLPYGPDRRCAADSKFGANATDRKLAGICLHNGAACSCATVMRRRCFWRRAAQVG